MTTGELPSRDEKERFVNTIKHHTMVHEQLVQLFRGFRRDAHPMAIMCGVTGALSAFYHDSTDIDDEWQREVQQIEARINQERERDMEFLLGEMTAVEWRAGRWVDETREAVQLAFMQSDPRFNER